MPCLPAKISLIASLCLVLGVVANSPAQEEGFDAESAAAQLQALMETGAEQLQSGEYEAAVATISQVIGSGGGYSSTPYVMRAKALMMLEDYQAALDDLAKAETYLQTAPQLGPEIKNTRAEIYIELEAYQMALPDLQAAAKEARGAPKVQFNLGKTLVKLGGALEGEKALTKFLDSDMAIDDNALRAEAYSLRGQAYGALGENEKALTDFASAIEIDPDDHEPYLGRASLAMRDKDFQGAIDDLKLSIEKYTPPEGQEEYPFVQGYLTLAAAYQEIAEEAVSEEQANEAYHALIAECEALLDLVPEDDPNMYPVYSATYFQRGVGERLLGELSRAVKSFSLALQYNPALGEAYFRRGICFHYMGEEKLAIRDFEQAAGINFDSPRSNLWKGLSWAKLGDYNEAIRAYGASIAVSDRYIPAYVNRGLAQIQRGEYEKAIADLNEAIRLQPTEPLHYYRRGKAYSLSGDSERAIQSYLAALEQDERMASAYVAIASELRATGRGDLAGEYELRAEALGL